MNVVIWCDTTRTEAAKRQNVEILGQEWTVHVLLDQGNGDGAVIETPPLVERVLFTRWDDRESICTVTLGSRYTKMFKAAGEYFVHLPGFALCLKEKPE